MFATILHFHSANNKPDNNFITMALNIPLCYTETHLGPNKLHILITNRDFVTQLANVSRSKRTYCCYDNYGRGEHFGRNREGGYH